MNGALSGAVTCAFRSEVTSTWSPASMSPCTGTSARPPLPGRKTGALARLGVDDLHERDLQARGRLDLLDRARQRVGGRPQALELGAAVGAFLEMLLERLPLEIS